MAFRVVMIENEVSIKLKLNHLIVTKEGEDIWIPLDDVSMIVMDNLATSITLRTMCQLSEQGIGLIVCDQKHLPCGYYGAYDNHSRSSKVLEYQLNKTTGFYDDIWQQIVEWKIQNQAEAYFKLKQDSEGKERINAFAKEVKPGDPTNREAHAAKVYFNQLMGSSFSRGNENILLNSGLDYGYSIIRSYIARACVGFGLNTQIGIHHRSEYNRFNLVDDLMEPLRPIVDIAASNILDGATYFMPEHRHKLVNILNEKMKYRGKNMYICNVIDSYVEQYASFIMERVSEICFPDIRQYEGEEKIEL